MLACIASRNVSTLIGFCYGIDAVRVSEEERVMIAAHHAPFTHASAHHANDAPFTHASAHHANDAPFTHGRAHSKSKMLTDRKNSTPFTYATEPHIDEYS